MKKNKTLIRIGRNRRKIVRMQINDCNLSLTFLHSCGNVNEQKKKTHFFFNAITYVHGISAPNCCQRY